MEKSKKIIYEYAKSRYLWEHERKNQLNQSITIPLGILIVQVTGFSYFLTNFPNCSCNTLFIVFIIFCVLTFSSIVVSIYLFYKQQSGYNYAYITNPSEMLQFRNNYVASYEDGKQKVDYEYIIDQLAETELEHYIEASEKNIQNNEDKVKYYRHFLWFIIISTILLCLTFFFHLLLKKIMI